jgi:hypothetical protein
MKNDLLEGADRHTGKVVVIATALRFIIIDHHNCSEIYLLGQYIREKKTD